MENGQERALELQHCFSESRRWAVGPARKCFAKERRFIALMDDQVCRCPQWPSFTASNLH